MIKVTMKGLVKGLLLFVALVILAVATVLYYKQTQKTLGSCNVVNKIQADKIKELEATLKALTPTPKPTPTVKPVKKLVK